MRTVDIDVLLKRSRAEMADFSVTAKSGAIDPVAMKNTLENMRSVLDYLAQDIDDVLRARAPTTKTVDRVYFPYGQRENHFKLSVNRNLPGLHDSLPNVLAAIEAFQPFRSADNWLVDLCTLTNDAKHNQLPRTHTTQTLTLAVPGGILASVSGEASASFYGNVVNGRLVDDVFVENGKVVQHQTNDATVIISTDNKIHFSGKDVEVIPFLENCAVKLTELVERVARSLSPGVSKGPGSN